ncbi:MAG: ABC transporter permease [Candidatus Heimdallarchaeota archaeon]
MGFGYYCKIALLNIWNGRRNAIIYFVGITIAITTITSINMWVTASESFVIHEFVEELDYELKVRTFDTEKISQVQNWLNNESLISTTDKLYYNLAFFNAEDKSPFYNFFPFDNQDDMNDRVSMSTLLLFPRNAISRIANQFTVMGEFVLEVNEVLISEHHANILEIVYGQPIYPGMALNLSVCKQSTWGGIYLFQYSPRHFYNITVKGIYKIKPTTSMLQESFSMGFLEDSIIFLKENLIKADIEQMEDNGLIPFVVAKSNSDLLMEDGVHGIIPKLDDIQLRLVTSFTNVFSTILDTPFSILSQEYIRSKMVYIIMLPVIVLGLMQAVLTSFNVLESRKKQIAIFIDRGGQKGQILTFFLLEFIIITIIAIAFSILSSYLLAPIIPSFTQSSFSSSKYLFYLTRLQFPVIPLILTSVAIIVLSSVFVLIKVNRLYSENKLSERSIEFRKKLEKNVSLILLGIIAVTLITILIMLIIPFKQEISDIYYFSTQQTKVAAYILALLLTLQMIIVIFASVGSFKIFGSLGKLYARIFKHNSLFLTHNFRRTKHKLNTLFIIIIMLSSSIFFSLIILATLQNNEKVSDYYNNGSDIRVETIKTSDDFYENITNINGIEEAMPIYQITGQHGYDVLTIYGINPEKYARIGRWDESSFRNDLAPIEKSGYTFTQWLSELENQHYGVFISDRLAKKHELSIGEIITIHQIQTETTTGDDTFIIVGIIHSAPGLGLASGKNMIMNQLSEEYILISDWKMQQDYEVKIARLFFAKTMGNFPLNQIEEEIALLDPVVEINHPSSEGSVTEFIDEFIPKLSNFIFAQLTFLFIIGTLTIVTNTIFILNQRKQNIAIMLALGKTYCSVLKLIILELVILIISGIIVGLLISLPVVYLTIHLAQPFLANYIIIPFNVAFNHLWMTISTTVIIGLVFVPIIPFLSRFRKQKLVESIYHKWL